MDRQAHFPGIRLLVAGVGSLILLAELAFPIFGLFGRTLGSVIPVVLCVFILVILTPVVIRGSGGERFLALLLAIFPALWLLITIWGAWAFAR